MIMMYLCCSQQDLYQISLFEKGRNHVKAIDKNIFLTMSSQNKLLQFFFFVYLYNQNAFFLVIFLGVLTVFIVDITGINI